MTVSSTATRIAYTGNASTTAFPFSFRFLATTDIAVYVDGVLQSTGYTVSSPGASGTVTFSTAPASGVSVVITRATAKTQETDYVANDAFSADSTELAFDRAMLAAQDNAAAIGRSLRVADHAAPVTAINMASAAGMLLGVNGGGTDFDLYNVPVTGVSLATQAQAEAGTVNTTVMTPLRTVNLLGYANDAFYVANADVGGTVGAGSATVDTAALKAGLTSGKRHVVIPGATLLVNYDSGMFVAAGQNIEGASYTKSIIRQNANRSNVPLISVLAVDGVRIANLTLDSNGKTDGGAGFLSFSEASDVRLEALRFLDVDRFAISANEAADWVIDDVSFEKLTPQGATQNQAIAISSVSGLSQRIRMKNIKSVGIGILADGADVWLTDSYVAGQKYGCAMTWGTSVNSIRGGVTGCYFDGLDDTSEDVNTTAPGAIEGWNPHAVFSNNIIRRWSGSGIAAGGQYQSVVGNVISDCGWRATVSGTYRYAALEALYFGAAAYQQASYSVFDGNIAFNTSGGTGPMDAGYREYASGNTNIRIGYNSFNNLRSGGPAGGYDIKSSSTIRSISQNIAYASNSWSPTVTSGTGAITSYQINAASYEKIGNRIFFEVTIRIVTRGSAGGAMIFTLPVVAASRSSFVGHRTDSGAQLDAYVAGSSSNVNVLLSASTGTPFTADDVYYNISGSYPVA